MLSFQNHYLQFSCPLNLSALGLAPFPCLTPGPSLLLPGRGVRVHREHTGMKTAKSLMAYFLGSQQHVKVLIFMAPKRPHPNNANPPWDVMSPLKGSRGTGDSWNQRKQVVQMWFEFSVCDSKAENSFLSYSSLTTQTPCALQRGISSGPCPPGVFTLTALTGLE